MRKSLVLPAAVLLAITFLSGTSDNAYTRLPRPLAKEFVFVPMGEARLGDSTMSVMAFYISRTEVTNAQYNQFLRALQDKGSTELLEMARIDSAAWQIPATYCEPYVETYHSHPAFADYPVVTINHEGASLYCAWLESMLNETYPGIRFSVRLPHRAEWVRAARLDHHERKYAWNGPYLRNSKGCYLCNFRQLGDESLHFDPETNTYEVVRGNPGGFDAHLITAPVVSYEANSLGIYNMNGNVAEMVRCDSIAVGGSWNSAGYDVRVESVMRFDGPSPMVGFRPLISIIQY